MRYWKIALTILFLFVVVVSGAVRYLQTSNFNTAITYDQARDLLDLRVMAGFHDLQVSGPTTSITGLNLGPYYYYLNLLPFWLGGGNPQMLVLWNMLLFLLSGGIIYYFFWKKNAWLGFLVATIYLMSPQLFSVTRYFWNANAVVYFIVFYFLALWNFVDNKNSIGAIVLGIAAGLVIQFEAAFGSMCVGFSIVVMILHKRHFGKYLFGLLPWFLPQLAFEIKHGFRMTQLFAGMLTGANPVLGDKIPFDQVAWLHWKTITPFFEGQFMLAYGLGFVLLVVGLAVILFDKTYRKHGLYLLSFLFFALVFYTIIYHHELKMWYLEGFRVWYCFVIGLAFACLTKYKKVLGMVVFIFLLRSFWLTVTDQQVYILANGVSDDPKNMVNLVRNIDWIYERMGDKGFEAYNYVPEVYDYPSQYLYWWYGVKQYGYMPERVSYSLATVPEYVRLSNKFYEKSRKQEDGLIALIYETKNTYQDWLGQFGEYCTVDKLVTNWRTTVEIRKKCVF